MPRLRLSVGLALTASLTAAGLTVAPPASAAPKCFGMTATIVGTPGADDLFGTGGPDVIVGLGGKDLLVGFGGDDQLCGGKGADDIDAGRGRDNIKAGAGHDLVGGGVAVDLVLGGAGNDLLYGGTSRDTLKGGKGSDVLFGDTGDDTLRGGSGFDVLLGEQQNDVLDGDGGEDLVSYYFSQDTGGITADLATGIATGQGTDTIKDVNGLEGSGLVNGSDDFTGAAGHNFFFPHEGKDTVDGGDGDDLVLYSEAPNAVIVDLAAGTATGEGADTLISMEMVGGSQFGDTLSGTDGANELYGLKGRDDIVALDGDDLLSGGKGTDTGDGGLGTDECFSIEDPTDCEGPGVTAASFPEVEEDAILLPSAGLHSLRPAY